MPVQHGPPSGRGSNLSLIRTLFGLPRAGGHELNLLFIGAADDHPLYINAWQMDAIGIQAAGRHHFLYFGNADFRGSGHGIIEVTSRFAEYEITRFVGFPSLDDRDVGKNPALQYIFLPVEDFHFLALELGRASCRERVCKYVKIW